MRTFKVLAALASAAALVATPAHAVISVGASTSCGYSQTCEGFAQDVVGVGSGSDVAVACSAYTPYIVQATIVSCYIKGNTGDTHSTGAVLTQGQASALTHTFPAWSLTSRSYVVCVSAGYFNGTYFAPANARCMPGV